MGLQVHCIDHQLLGRPVRRRQLTEYPVEYAHFCTSSETVVECLVWPYSRGASFHLRPFFSTYTISEITRLSLTPGTPCDFGKKRSIFDICAGESRNSLDMAKLLCHGESSFAPQRKSMDPEPKTLTVGLQSTNIGSEGTNKLL